MACFEIKLIRISRKRSLDYHPAMIGLTDSQLKIIMTAANTVPVERRDIFLQRVGAMLSMRHRFSDTDVVDVTTLAIAGLIQRTHQRPPLGQCSGTYGVPRHV